MIDPTNPPPHHVAAMWLGLALAAIFVGFGIAALCINILNRLGVISL